MSQLEDTFAGQIELTASELAYLRHAISELYANGGWSPAGVNRREFAKRVLVKLGALRLSMRGAVT